MDGEITISVHSKLVAFGLVFGVIPQGITLLVVATILDDDFYPY